MRGLCAPNWWLGYKLCARCLTARESCYWLANRKCGVMYNCLKCPGYCCSYPLIQLTKRDVERLARHFGLGFEEARKKFTKVEVGAKYAMRRKADEHFGQICRFFDTEKRRCTIYTARPTIC